MSYSEAKFTVNLMMTWLTYFSLLKAVFYPLVFVQIAYVYLCSVVQFTVGVMTYKQHSLRIWRGLHCVLKVEPSVTASEILKLAVPVLREMELELPDGEYCLVYSNKKLADKVPLSDEPFTLEAYKAFVGKPYQKLTLYICPVEDYNAGMLCTLI